MGWPFQSEKEFEAHLKKKIDEAIKKDRANQKTTGDTSEKLSRLYERDLQNLGTMSEILKSITNQTDLFRKSLAQLGEDGAFFVKGGPLQQGLNETIKKFDELMAQPGKGAEAFRQLTLSIKNFAQIAKATEDVQGGLAASLSQQAGILNELGLSYGNFSKNVDFAIYSMGQSSGVVEGLNLSLMDLSKSIGVLPDEVSRNFQMVAKNLAYSFTGIKQQFVQIQKLSQETGVSIDNLMGKFGQRMDTISGASEMAARINSLIGANAFSATELLMMDETTRMEKIRAALMNSQAGEIALNDGGVQGKFALQSINEVLGLGLDDTRRFLQTGGLKGQIRDQVDADFGSSITGDPGGMQKFKDAAEPAADALSRFTDVILRFLKPAQEQAIRSRAETLRDPGNFLQQFGNVAQTGETGEINEAMIRNLDFKDLMFIYNQDTKQAEALGIERSTLTDIATRINAGGSVALQAQRDARNLRNVIGAKSAIRGGLSPIQQSIIAQTPDDFGMKAAVIDKLRQSPGELLGITPDAEGKVTTEQVEASTFYKDTLKAREQAAKTVPSNAIPTSPRSLNLYQQINIAGKTIRDEMTELLLEPMSTKPPAQKP